MLHFNISPCVPVILPRFWRYLLWDVNPIILVLIGVAAGFLIGGIYERKEAKQNGSA